MAEVDRFRPEDRRSVEALYRRVFGNDAADASRLRWDWQYRRNPNNPDGTPIIWLAREGPSIIGQYATMPVRLWVRGREVPASWGTDVMVAPERQRQGVGEVLFRTWDRNVGASLGLGLSESSHQLFKKLRWPEAGPVPCLVKPLTRRAFKRPNWPEGGIALCPSSRCPWSRSWRDRGRCARRLKSFGAFHPSSRIYGSGWPRSSTSPYTVTRTT